MRQADWRLFQVLTKRSERLAQIAPQLPWPTNVWIGVFIETDRYSIRADHLRDVPAVVRFISAEPLLGPLPSLKLYNIHWVITGGESGLGYRPCNPDWVRDLRDRCLASTVAFFHKQWGGITHSAGGRLLDGRTWDQVPDALSPNGQLSLPSE